MLLGGEAGGGGGDAAPDEHAIGTSAPAAAVAAAPPAAGTSGSELESGEVKPDSGEESSDSGEQSEGEGGGNGEDNDEDEAWGELEEFCLYSALGLSRGFSGGFTRVTARYHKAVASKRRGAARVRRARAGNAISILELRRVTTAFLVLRDEERRRVYDEGGWCNLRKAEVYMEENAFDADPFEVLDSFFAAADEATREYLMLNGDGVPSDSESEGGEDQLEGEHAEDGQEESEDEAGEAVLAAAAKAAAEARAAAQKGAGKGVTSGAEADTLPRAPLILGAAARPEADPWAELQSRAAKQKRLEEFREQERLKKLKKEDAGQ